jgi:glycogen synthase
MEKEDLPMDRLKVVYMTREFPPHIYGGAGVHIEHLARHMARLAEVQVKCFGDQSLNQPGLSVQGHPFEESFFDANPLKVKQALMVLLTSMRFNALPIVADVVHTHTWYAAWGGILARLCYGIPLAVTVHSLEPLRPWKREQLGRGYDLSSWVERTALEMADRVIAVSGSDRGEILARFQVDADRVRVIPNGIEPEVYQPVSTVECLQQYGIDPGLPYVLFLGRVSRQKGIHHFLNACRDIDPGVQIVLCAGSPDTPCVAEEIEARWAELQKLRSGLVWIREMIPRRSAIELYSHAAVFCCPSVYEPFGIINLEAMACETPVVASAVGGIKDVVIDGETGFLVFFERQSSDNPEPRDPERFIHELAQSINRLLRDSELGVSMGRKGRQRVIQQFGWDRVAEQVLEVYREMAEEKPKKADME